MIGMSTNEHQLILALKFKKTGAKSPIIFYLR